MAPVAKRILVSLLVAGLALLGLGSVLVAADGFRAARTEARPLAPLCQVLDLSASHKDGPPYAAPDGALVRVEGLLRAEPPLPSPALPGSQAPSYALQQLSVRRGRWSRVFRVAKAPRLWLHVDPEQEAGSGRIEVRLPHLWTGEELSVGSLSGEVGDAGTAPNGIAVALSPALQAPVPEAGQEWTLWRIAQGERVTVVARARHEAGRIVLAGERGEKCIVSQRPWPSLMGDANIWAAAQLVLGVACLSPAAYLGCKYLQGRRARRAR